MALEGSSIRTVASMKASGTMAREMAMADSFKRTESTLSDSGGMEVD